MQPTPPYNPQQPNPTDQERAGLFRAGKVALWVWIVCAIVPVVIVLLCCGLCGFGGVIGAVTDTPSPYPS